MMRGLMALVAVICLGLAGPVALAKLLLVLGLPRLAAPLLDDPAVQGVALYQAEDYAAADEAFRQAGRNSTYNRGLSLATTGDLSLARDYFDAVLFANPADSEARENRNLLNALIPPNLGEGNAAGRLAVQVIARAGEAPLDDVRRLSKPLALGGRVADSDWLQGLQDDPAEFLRLRLLGEHQRRMALGLNAAEEGDPW